MKDDTWVFYPYIQHSPSDFTAQPHHQKEVSQESKLRRTNSGGKTLRVFSPTNLSEQVQGPDADASFIPSKGKTLNPL